MWGIVLILAGLVVGPGGVSWFRLTAIRVKQSGRGPEGAAAAPSLRVTEGT